MAKRGGRVLQNIGTAESGPADGKVGGEPVVLVGDTDDIKGTKGDPGATGPAWEPEVVEVTLDMAAPTGAINLGGGNFLPVYAKDEA